MSDTKERVRCTLCGEWQDFGCSCDALLKTPSANQIQIGGDHYRKVPGEQLWDRMWRRYGPSRGRSFFIGSILSYLERYEDKEGMKDLKKAAHWLQKLIELEEQATKDGKEGSLPEYAPNQTK